MKIYALIKEVYDDLEIYVEPYVEIDIRAEREKLREVLELLEDENI